VGRRARNGEPGCALRASPGHPGSSFSLPGRPAKDRRFACDERITSHETRNTNNETPSPMTAASARARRRCCFPLDASARGRSRAAPKTSPRGLPLRARMLGRSMVQRIRGGARRRRLAPPRRAALRRGAARRGAQHLVTPFNGAAQAGSLCYCIFPFCLMPRCLDAFPAPALAHRTTRVMRLETHSLGHVACSAAWK